MNDEDEPATPPMSAVERAAQRRQDLDEVVLPRIRAVFDKRPELRSALFVVAQYYSDNAMDEVHGHIVFSEAEIPHWPHVCPWPRSRPTRADVCTRCLRTDDDSWGNSPNRYFSLPYQEATFRAWEAYCREGTNQEQDLGEAYAPFLIATPPASRSRSWAGRFGAGSISPTTKRSRGRPSPRARAWSATRMTSPRATCSRTR